MSWETAATNIQAALDESYSDGELRTLVLVTNGTYIVQTPLQIIRDITMKGVNGAANTILSANNATERRVLNVNSPGAVVEGFTITRGNMYPHFYGGGIRLDAGTLRHCRIPDNYGGYGSVFMADATDLDGESRTFMSKVDMGCYQTPPARGTIFMLR